MSCVVSGIVEELLMFTVLIELSQDNHELKGKDLIILNGNPITNAMKDI